MRMSALPLALCLLVGTLGAAAAESVAVRFGLHADFGRVVFEWEKPIGYQMSGDGQRRQIEFDRAGEFDAAQLRRKPPTGVEKVSVLSGRSVELVLQPGAELKHALAGGRKLVIDVTPAASPAATPTEARPPGSKASPAPAATQPSAPDPKPRKPPEATPAPVRSASTPDSKRPGAVTTDGELLPVALETGDAGPRLAFGWTTGVGAAVALRASRLWVVFDRAKGVDLSGLSSMPAQIHGIEQVPLQDATALRIEIAPGLAPIVLRRQAEWLVELRPAGEAKLPQPVEVRSEAEKGAGIRVWAGLPQGGKPIRFRDPEVGDTLVFVPSAGFGIGVNLPRQYPQFRILESAQGILAALRDERVIVEPAKDGYAFKAAGGLLMSDDVGSSAEVLLDIAKWRGADARFSNAEHDRLRQAAAAPGEAGDSGRIELARYYFAHGMAQEALGAINRAVRANPKLIEERANRLLRGAAAVLAKRPKDAEPDLHHADLTGEREAALWRGRLAVQRAQWTDARDEFQVGQATLAAYPDDWRGPFLLDMAEAQVNLRDAKAAEQLLSGVAADRLDAHRAAELALLGARAAELAGDRGRAAAGYARAIESGIRPIVARGVLELTRMEMAAGGLKPAKAIERLETIRYAWRGDALEVAILRQLAELYLTDNRPREGLAAYKAAISLAAQSPDAKEMAAEMNRGFARFYLEGGAEKLPTLEALAIYYDFRELVPVGADGDRIMGRLAERAQQLELLDRAADLLEHQVNQRLTGPAKAQAALELAAVRLKDRKAEQALKALQVAAQGPLSEAAQAERRLLEARSFIELGKADEALRALGGDQSAPAMALRADIHWRRKNWAAAADALWALMRPAEGETGQLDPALRQTALQLAVALSFADDGAGVDRLRNAFAARFEGTPEMPAFRVLTTRVNRNEVEFRELASRIAAVGTLDAFLAAYRERQQKTQQRQGS